MIRTADPESADKAIGLFSKFQLQQFKGPNLGSDVSQDILNNEIKRIKAPTLYETANYMVPSPDELNRSMSLDSVGQIPGAKTSVNGLSNYTAFIFAPLHSPDQEDVFWNNGEQVVTTVFEFLRAQKSGIEKYKRNMIQAAIEINSQGLNLAPEAVGARAGFTRAANGVADVNFAGGLNQPIGSCASLAGVFLYFYYGDPDLDDSMVSNNSGCPQTLGQNLRKYFSSSVSAAGFSPSHYQMDYTYNPAMQRAPNSLFTAYMPGTFTGVDADAVFRNPIPGSDVEPETMRRNFYSTKFVQLGSLTASGPWSETTSNFVMYSEGDLATSPGSDRSQTQYRNPLDAQAVGVDLNAIRY